jgi:hypothetical protein
MWILWLFFELFLGKVGVVAPHTGIFILPALKKQKNVKQIK